MNTLNRIILVYGSITGATIIGSMMLGIYAAQAGGNSFLASEALGYSIMFIGFSMIFVATKKYRDQELGGVIKFKEAFRVGLGISLLSGVVYVLTWEVNLFVTDYVFITEYTDSIIEKAREAGVSENELESTIQKMEEMKVKYDNPVYRLPITFTEIFPMGLFMSLVSAGLFRNPNFLPSNKTA